MTTAWPLVPLGQLLKPVSRAEPVDPSVTYRILGAHWYAKGLYVKEVKRGSDIRSAKLFRVEEGDFVYNRLFGWKGSFAIATRENHGCYVSNEFPCFSMDQDRLDPQYLWRYFSRSLVWQEALGLSTGGTPTSRNRLKEEKLLGLRIPLPPLAEQRRIVARIEELAGKIEQARVLRQLALGEAEALIRAEVISIRENDTNWTKLPLGEVCDILDSQRRPVNAHERAMRRGSIPYYGAGKQVGWIDDYLFDEPLVLLAEDGGPFDWRCAYLIQGKSWVNNHAHVLRGTKVLNEWFMWMLRSTDLAPFISGSTRAKLTQRAMCRIPIPIPPLSDQRRFVAHLDGLQAKADTLQKLQAETAAELDALLPSILDKAFKGEL